MLDHDELLPEEQAYPGIVEELRTVYQMKPAEKQALIRVRERLAQSVDALPQIEPVQAGEYTRKQRVESPVVSSSRNMRAGWKWLRHFNTLAAALFVAVLVGSLVFTFAIIGHSRLGSSNPTGTAAVTNDIRVLLAPAGGITPSQAEMEATRALLSQRFRDFGLNRASVRVLTANGRPEILAELPHFGGDEQRIITMLVETGSLAFWNTGSIPLALGTTLNPAQFIQSNPGGKPLFTNRDLDPGAFAISYDAAGRPLINCIMQGEAIGRFQTYTARNIGNFLTVTLDGTVIESAVIQSAIDGPFELSLNYTGQQAKAFIAIIKHGPLPVELKRLT